MTTLGRIPRYANRRAFAPLLVGLASLAADAHAAEPQPLIAAPQAAIQAPSTIAPDSTAEPRATQRPRRFAADVTATTLIPISVGPELTLELPGRVLAQAHLGWMPELYRSTITDALEDAGVYDDTIGAVVDGAFQGATTWRFGVGWRPFESAGLELGASYVRVAMDGSTTTSEIARVVTPALAEQIEEQAGNVGLALDSTLHHFMLGIGWRWLVAERLVIRSSLSYLQAFDSRSEIEIESFPALTRATEPIVNGVLHDHYMRYVKIPVIGFGVGYRFF